MNTGQTLDSPSTPASIRIVQRGNLVARGLFLTAALLSFGFSVALFFSGEENAGIFVGLWVPSILALGAFLAPRRDPEPPSPAEGGSR